MNISNQMQNMYVALCQPHIFKACASKMEQQVNVAKLWNLGRKLIEEGKEFDLLIFRAMLSSTIDLHIDRPYLIGTIFGHLISGEKDLIPFINISNVSSLNTLDTKLKFSESMPSNLEVIETIRSGMNILYKKAPALTKISLFIEECRCIGKKKFEFPETVRLLVIRCYSKLERRKRQSVVTRRVGTRYSDTIPPSTPGNNENNLTVSSNSDISTNQGSNAKPYKYWTQSATDKSDPDCHTFEKFCNCERLQQYFNRHVLLGGRLININIKSTIDCNLFVNIERNYGI
uniref:RB_A domain-containing protein n=1 Tax=Rhabditophanes sp. KR3021 TaxID=114890 RepID=A0AC35TI41_9BILA